MPLVPPYELLDVGAGGRLERFGERVVDRPAPAALDERGDPGAWRVADLRYDRDRGWSGPAADAGPWTVEVAPSVSLELRATEAGQVGLFPEHLAMLPWLAERAGRNARDALGPGAASKVLSLFAYTGLATLALARDGVPVTHVDASRPSVTWARRNAELSGLAGRPVRWIVDDAPAFVRREVRRGRRYGGLIVDPPTYGHGPSGHAWTMDALPALLADCRALLEPDAFILLSAHTPGYDPDRLAGLLADGTNRRASAVEADDLLIRTVDGRSLAVGAFARSAGRA
jgi:23S rRNA (cytosine1962-C5)-methyltransferase